MHIEQLIVGSMGVCCYVVHCEDTLEGIVIDPGGDEKRILAYCDKAKVKVKAIVATHGHPDHVCGNAVLREKTGAPIVMFAGEAKFFGLEETRRYFSILGLPESPPPDRTVSDGETIAFGKEGLTVIHTPGHTPGGICLYSAPHLFTGDTLFAGGVGRTDFPGGNSAMLLRSLRERLLTLPEDTIVWPGHGYGGESSTIGMEKKSNPFLTGAF